MGCVAAAAYFFFDFLIGLKLGSGPRVSASRSRGITKLTLLHDLMPPNAAIASSKWLALVVSFCAFR